MARVDSGAKQYQGRLERLNELSLSRSFTPELDIDWQESTTDEEYESLYSAWSLLEGTGLDRDLDRSGRVAFAKYQQANLMLFTGLLERHGIASLARLYDLDSSQPFAEYIGHFIKEETYHYTMFTRAVARIYESMPDAKRLPAARIDRLMRWVFRLLHWLPGHRLRSSLTFSLFRFAEQVTIYAHQMVSSRIPRTESLVHQVWAYHALDEARHLAFDDMILERNRLWRPIAWLPRALAAPCCVVMSLALNANEIWAARQLGVNVRLWQLPWLFRHTKAPFKRRVFQLLRSIVGGRPAATGVPESPTPSDASKTRR